VESKGFDAGERSVSFVFVCFPWVVLLIFQKPIASGYMMSLLLVCLGGSHADFGRRLFGNFLVVKKIRDVVSTVVRVSLGESQGAHEFGGQWANQEARVLIRAAAFWFSRAFCLCFALIFSCKA